MRWNRGGGRWWVLTAIVLGACGEPSGRERKPSGPAVDITVLELRVQARVGEIAVLKERVRADTRQNPTRSEIDLSDLQERLTAVRVRLDALKAAEPSPPESAQRDFEQADDNLKGTIREFKARYAL